jgi:hypothetical protein
MVLDTLEKNGVFEQKICTFADVIIVMLSHSCISNSFWGEALITTNYL